MKFEELFALGYEYDRTALSHAIQQINDYNNTPTSKERERAGELAHDKVVQSNEKEKDIFEKHLIELQKEKVLQLSYRVAKVMTKVDDELKNEIYNCVINEVKRIIDELSNKY